MKSGSLALNGVFAASVAVLWLLPADVAGQGRARSNKPAAKEAAAPQRTPWGDPDLQGLWTNTTTTPLERLPEASTKTVLTEEERLTLSQQVAERLDQDKPPARAGTIVPYNEFWYERGTLTNRTSLIIDPPDGKIPPFTPAAQKRWQEQLDARKEHPADSWLDRSAYDRCISRGMPGTMLPGFYNHNYEIVQAPGYVAILVEMIHDTRIIPLDGRPHMNGTVRQWLGDPRGHWEGNTLVVENHELQRQDVRARRGHRLWRRRAVDRTHQAHRRRPTRLRAHGRGSGDVHPAMDRFNADDQDGRPFVRVCVPRGQLRHVHHPVWCTRPGGRKPQEMNRESRMLVGRKASREGDALKR